MAKTTELVGGFIDDFMATYQDKELVLALGRLFYLGSLSFPILPHGVAQMEKALLIRWREFTRSEQLDALKGFEVALKEDLGEVPEALLDNARKRLGESCQA
jgi:hypothetical protein